MLPGSHHILGLRLAEAPESGGQAHRGVRPRVHLCCKGSKKTQGKQREMHIADSSSGKAISLTLFNGFLDRFHEIAPKSNNKRQGLQGFPVHFFVFPNPRFTQGILMVLHVAISHHIIVESLMVSGRALMHFLGTASKSHHKRQGL